MKREILSNGMKILYNQMTNTHSVTIGLYVKAGSAYEESRQNGITHLLEHLHFRRLGELSQNELYYRMESIGSTLRASTYRDFLKFSMKIAPEYIPDCIYIFKKLICTDKWDIDSLEKEKEVVINQINEKNEYVSIESLVRKTVFAGSALSNDIMGSEESVKHLTLVEITEYKKKIFNKNNMIFCVTGNFNETDKNLIQDELGGLNIPDGREITGIVLPSKFKKRGPTVVFKSHPSKLLDVNLSFDITYNEDDFTEINLLNCIIGEGVGSRLQTRIREELLYTSDILSYLEIYSKFCVLNIEFSIISDLLNDCLTDIVDILNLIKRNITKRDLDVSLPFYTTNSVFNEDDTEQMNFILAYYSFILGINYYELHSDSIKETIDDLHSIAREVFIPGNACIAVMGETDRISKNMIKKILLKLD